MGLARPSLLNLELDPSPNPNRRCPTNIQLNIIKSISNPSLITQNPNPSIPTNVNSG
jgi:hypothetical protein